MGSGFYGVQLIDLAFRWIEGLHSTEVCGLYKPAPIKIYGLCRPAPTQIQWSSLAGSGLGPGYRARASFIGWLIWVGPPGLPLGQI